MSNKMLWKRLLAAGMSMAMAATLFATNSITIFAGEGDPIEVISVVPEAPSAPAALAADAATEESTSEPQVSPTDGLPAPEVEEYVDNFPPFEGEEDHDEEVLDTKAPIVNEYDFCTGTVDVTLEKTIAVTDNEYYSDKNDVEANGAQGNDNIYEKVEKDQIDKEHDHIDYVETNVSTSVETTVKLIDKCTLEEAKGLDANGKPVPVELPEDFQRQDLKEVTIITEENGHIHEVGYLDPNVVFGFFDANGDFVKLYNYYDKRGAYYYKNGGDDYTVTEEVHYYEGRWGHRIYVDDEIYDALDPKSDSEKYEKVVEYKFDEEAISKADLENKDGISNLDQWGYTVDAKAETPLPLEEPLKGTMRNPKAVVSYEKVKITKINDDGTAVGNFYFTYGKNQYVVEEPVYYLGNANVGDEIQMYPGIFNHHEMAGREDVLQVIPEQPEKEVLSTVTLKDGEKVVWTGDKDIYDAITTDTYSKITSFGTKYKVELKEKDEEGNAQYAYIDKKDYSIIRNKTNKLEVVNSYYYTVQDKNVEKEVPVTIDGQTYNLTVGFWQNKRIGVKDIAVVYPETGDPYLSITYTYSAYDEDGNFVAKVETLNNPEYTAITADSFVSTGKAKMNIKYTPAYSSFTYPEEQYVKSSDYRSNNMLKSSGMRMKLRAVNLLAKEQVYAPETIPGTADDGKWHASHLYGPMVKIDPVGEPVPGPTPEEPTPTPEEPTPTPERAPWITTAAIEETPVALAATVAPAGQVLGAQREEATGEAPAVLGASRARGTADETTAPFVRVLVMAAVASAALFLTRKREEEN